MPIQNIGSALIQKEVIGTSLVKALRKKFAPESNWATFQAALETRMRRKEESLDTYMSAIKTLARKAFHDWDGSYRDITVNKYFIDGLEEPLRLWVLQANPQTADQALQVALRIEANMRQKTQAAVAVNQTNTTADLAEAIAIALEKRGIGNRQNFPVSFVCVEVLRPSQPNGVMSSAVSLPKPHVYWAGLVL